MRTGYSVTKVTAFCGLALANALSGFPAEATLGISVTLMLGALRVIVWSAVIFCVARGLPVLVAGLPRLRDA
jgi:hypothetical protein